ncbi:SPOR domain-containing protein [Pedobacter sp. MW01-1-1]|uniref:HU domain-containing protein n=1 Tax=Pedobacter sp. MW01-1-1 TaxID=3383027 RepID=UPI003FEE1DB1
MDILSYLLELLQQQKEVGITGLGTFYKKKSPGRYDKEKQSFLPPTYTLQFNTEVKEQDALATFISAKRNISTESANYYITQFAEELHKQLAETQEADLPNIGRLFFTEHEGLTFEAIKNVHYGSEFFGLPNIAETQEAAPSEHDEQPIFEEIAEAPLAENVSTDESTPVEAPIIENIELDEVKDDLRHTLDISTTAAEKSATYHQLSEDTAQPEEEITEAPEFIQKQHAEHPNRFGHDPIPPVEEEQKNSLWPKMIIALIIVVAIIALAYFIKPELFITKQNVEPAVTETIDSTQLTIDSAKIKQDSIAKADSILKENLVTNSKKEDSLKKVIAPIQATDTVKPSKGIGRFHIIGASFKTMKKAELFVEQMKAYGLDAKVVPIEGTRKKVSIASYKTEKEALEARPELSKKIHIKELDIKQINIP